MHLLKSLLCAVLAFIAACSVGVDEGGHVLVQLPALTSLVSHPDLYAAGLLLLVEVFTRVFPSPENNSFLSSLVRLADQLLLNRAAGGGHWATKSILTNGSAS